MIVWLLKTHNRAKLVENLVTALDNGDYAVGFFVDFQKAFDTVNRSILLDTLSFDGVRYIAHTCQVLQLYLKSFTIGELQWP